MFLQCFRQNKIIVQVASENIRVNCIAPGIIKTKFAEVILCPSMVSSLLSCGQNWKIIWYFPRPWQIMRILPTKRWKTFLLAGESYSAGAMVHCAESYLKVAKYWDGQQLFNFQFWLIAHCYIHHVSVQLLKIDHVSQIWPAWRDGGHRELFGVGRGEFCFPI